MAILYTAKQIQDMLKALRIKLIDGMVSTGEAARILTWRAKEEQGIEHAYPASAVRRHIQSGNLKAYPVSIRYNRYKVEDVFDIPLVPRRGIGQKTLKMAAVNRNPIAEVRGLQERIFDEKNTGHKRI